jgi:hypothetical protein
MMYSWLFVALTFMPQNYVKINASFVQEQKALCTVKNVDTKNKLIVCNDGQIYYPLDSKSKISPMKKGKQLYITYTTKFRNTNRFWTQYAIRVDIVPNKR